MSRTHLPSLRPWMPAVEEPMTPIGGSGPRLPNLKLCIEPEPKNGKGRGQKAVYAFLLQELQPLFVEMGQLKILSHKIREEMHQIYAELQQIRDLMNKDTDCVQIRKDDTTFAETQKHDAVSAKMQEECVSEDFICVADPRHFSPVTPNAMTVFNGSH